MREQRTLTDWAVMVLLALLGLTVGLLWTTSLINRNLRIEADELRQQLEQAPEPSGTGGAEILVPEFDPVASWRFPLAEVDYRVFTSPYGYRVSPFLDVEVWHEGLDIAGVWRAMVVAVEDGVVVEHWPPPDGYWRGHDTYGGMVVIEHADGIRVLYAHLSWTRVHTGDEVRAGQVIGRMGATGKSDGAHLHMEVTAPDGTLLNPALYIADPREGA